MIFGKPDWKTFNKGIEKEWLLTNGLGSFASSTIIGTNTRRYHGLLVASFRPPVDRHLVISKFDETLQIGEEFFELYTNQTPNHVDTGYNYLQKVEVDKTVTFTYSVKDVIIEKKISMIYGENTVVVVYKIINGTSEGVFKVSPIVNFRDYHGNTARGSLHFNTTSNENGVVVKPVDWDRHVEIRSSEGAFVSQVTWFYNMDYAIERERGLNPVEDHYMPGYFEIKLLPREEKVITFIGTTETIETLDGPKLIKEEEERLEKVIKHAGYNDEFANALVMAADRFIVKRESTGAKTIIAGYPWFTDWGRDTMIALPGLTLSTKRYDDAKEIFISFVKHMKNGLIPNMFPDAGQEPIYNTVDASLWFFEAVFKFLEHTKEYSFVKDNIYSALKDIIENYKKGTDYNIHMGEDGLIYSGNMGTQLTWMDAKVGEWVVTPRHGKAVEINALWYNALKIMNILSRKFGEDHKPYEKLATLVKRSFEQFWNEEGYLYDVIDGDFKDAKIRPNQILAVSLSYPVVDGEKASKIVDMVFSELYATFGLRSLSQGDIEYKGYYFGDQFKRDGAYHQGTVWSWLMGPFITAYMKVNNSKEGKEMCLKLLEPLKSHLADAGVGSISEIFDGNEPILPRGCFAQAWGVGEVLRVYSELLKGKK